MTEYTTMPEVPGRLYFRCDRYAATLSTLACANNWREGNYKASELRAKCKCCPLGAEHAGEVGASMSALKGSLICSRCHRTASRLISKNLCVSCQNRQYEYVKGRNAKGTAPVKLAALQPRRIKVDVGGAVKLLYSPLTADTDELVITALRDCLKQVRFGFHGVMAAVRGQQMRLF